MTETRIQQSKSWFKNSTNIITAVAAIITLTSAPWWPQVHQAFQKYSNEINRPSSIILLLIGIIVVFLILSALFRLFFKLYKLLHNFTTIKKYKRENKDNDRRYTTKRCKEDGDENRRHHVMGPD